MKLNTILLLCMLSVASASDDTVASLPMPNDGMTDFEYLLSIGMDKELAEELIEEGAHGAPETPGKSNLLDDLGICEGFFNSGGGDDGDDADYGNRDELFRNLCGTVSNLLGDSVTCSCSRDILDGTMSYECEAKKETNWRNITMFTPSYFGEMVFQIFSVDLTFTAGFCLNNFTVSIPWAAGPELRILGEMCLNARYGVNVDLNPPSLQGNVEACSFLAGEFGECEICESCLTFDDIPGYAVNCSFLDATPPCIPLLLPINRASAPLDLPELAGWVDFSHL